MSLNLARGNASDHSVKTLLSPENKRSREPTLNHWAIDVRPESGRQTGGGVRKTDRRSSQEHRQEEEEPGRQTG